MVIPPPPGWPCRNKIGTFIEKKAINTRGETYDCPKAFEPKMFDPPPKPLAPAMKEPK